MDNFESNNTHGCIVLRCKKVLQADKKSDVPETSTGCSSTTKEIPEGNIFLHRDM